MLKVIKKPTVVLTVFMAAMATSCTNDDYSFFGDDDLNLNSQIPMTRSTSEGSDDSGFSYKKGECGIWCVLKLQHKESSYSTYCHACDSAKTLGWTDDGETPLTGSQMQRLGNMFGIEFQDTISNKDINMNYTGNANDKLDELLIEAHENGFNEDVANTVLSINNNSHYVVLKNETKGNSNYIDVYDVNSTNPNHIRSIPKSSISGLIH